MNMLRSVPTCALLWFAISSAAWADHPTPKGADAGKSAHGEAFNEGPRQRAYLMQGMPSINFAVTTDKPEAQQFFNQGIGQLHGFWYLEAERSFRQAAAIDPNCAMAYWGMAMSNFNNHNRARGFIQKATERKASASRREQMWIDSLSAYMADGKREDKERRKQLVKALEELSYEFPDDIEIKAFLTFHIWDNANSGMSITSHQAVDALAQQVLAANPMHPVHHYRIHLWNGEKDKRALESAARCGQSAPGIAHMWHMSGHTYSELRRYSDAAWQQEASARVDHAHMIRDRVMPEQIHNYAHNNDWLVSDLSHTGRVREAIDLAKNMVELPRPHAGSAGYNMGRNRLFEVLGHYELWDETIALADTMYLEPTAAEDQQLRRLRALGVAWVGKQNRERATEQIVAIETLGHRLAAERLKAVGEAEDKAVTEKKPADQIEKAKNDARGRFNDRQQHIDTALADLRAGVALLDQNLPEARRLLELVKDLSKTRQSQVYLALGDRDKAEALAREAADGAAGQVQPLANYAGVLWQVDKKPQALEQFDKLLAISSQMDLELPVVKRLEPILRERNLPTDWRKPYVQQSDVGVRPELASLGPFRWHPSPAPSWQLSDMQGNLLSLEQYRGKPVLLVFYLGAGCPHCIEQLNAIAPLAKDFTAAGISIIAVSTDSVTGLKETFDQIKEENRFAFPIVSNEDQSVFKSYRAFDDFENAPLHGVYLIDGAGLVRWQDISFQPYKEIAFLLGEAKRLLTLPAQLPPAQSGKNVAAVQ